MLQLARVDEDFRELSANIDIVVIVKGNQNSTSWICDTYSVS